MILHYFYEIVTESVAETREYTDDSQMTMDVLHSIIECNGVNSQDMAQRYITTLSNILYLQFIIEMVIINELSFCRRFTNGFFANQERGYGARVRNVFHELRESKFEDIYAPAKAQFNGQGSLGNGAGMRASPFGLIGYSARTVMLQGLVRTSQITHAHPVGVCGAIFQAVSVREALIVGVSNANPLPTHRNSILERIEEALASISKDTAFDAEYSVDFEVGMKPYFEKLGIVKEILAEEEPSLDRIRSSLGTGVTGPESIPTALYCFLAGFNDIKGIQVGSCTALWSICERTSALM